MNSNDRKRKKLGKIFRKDLLGRKMGTKGYREFNQGVIEIRKQICWSNDKTVSGLDYLNICQWRADQLFAKAEGLGKYWSALYRQITESIIPGILKVLSTLRKRTFHSEMHQMFSVPTLTSFPVSLILPPPGDAPGDGKMRDPGNEVVPTLTLVPTTPRNFKTL